VPSSKYNERSLGVNKEGSSNGDKIRIGQFRGKRKNFDGVLMGYGETTIQYSIFKIQGLRF
jgi:hypothetical protein